MPLAAHVAGLRVLLLGARFALPTMPLTAGAHLMQKSPLDDGLGDKGAVSASRSRLSYAGFASVGGRRPSSAVWRIGST